MWACLSRLAQAMRFVMNVWIVGLLLSLFLPPFKAKASELYLHYVVENYLIQTRFADYSNIALAGAGAEYVHAFTDKFHVRGVGGVSFDLASSSPVFLEAGGGGALSLIGGAPLSITNTEFSFVAAPHQHLFVYLDVVQRLYDVTATVPPPVQEKTGERRRVARIGNYLAPKFGLGYDFYMNPEGFATVGVRGFGTQSLNLDELSITTFGVSVTVGFQFVDDIFMRFFQGG